MPVLACRECWRLQGHHHAVTCPIRTRSSRPVVRDSDCVQHPDPPEPMAVVVHHGAPA